MLTVRCPRRVPLAIAALSAIVACRTPHAAPAASCPTSSGQASAFVPIPDFTAEVNAALAKFLDETREAPGRKVAVFDGDGTVLGQVPHYLADECLFEEARRSPAKHADVIDHMRSLSNVSVPYIMDRVYFYEGETLDALRQKGDDCFRRLYANKIYPGMRALVAALQGHGFEVFVVTGSPEALYQSFLSRELQIPPTRVLGAKAVVHGGALTREVVQPVPQDHGKKETIETFIQEQPLFVAGNSRGDKDMLEYSRGLRMVVNPDEFVAEGQTESLADYARHNHWLIVRQRDVTEPGFPATSSKVYKIRENASHE